MGGGIASMKALCNREGLLDAFSKVSGVVPARSPKPILQNVKLVADPEDGSILMATDLEVGIRCRVLGVKVDQPGAVILPTQRMQSILRALSDEELAIEADGDQLVVRGLHAAYKLPSEAPDLFPEIPDFAATAYHAIAAADLRRLIRRTMFATDGESTRYALGGVLVELKPDSVTMVGTDGRRLAHQVAEAQAEGGAEAPPGNPVIPVKALKLIERNLDDTDPPVHLAIQGGGRRPDPHRPGCHLLPPGRGPLPPLSGRLPGQRRGQGSVPGDRPLALGRGTGLDRHQRGKPGG
jgi:DNA polymerase-3 subunit beta